MAIITKKTSFPPVFYLEDLNGANGFIINGNGTAIYHTSVSGAGDINNDGIDDLIIGNSTGERSYVVFGNQNGFPSAFNLLNLNGTNGFAISGDGIGNSVSKAGDVNADGIDDLIIGAPSINSGAGQSYVVYGSDNRFPATLLLSVLDGTNGFTINGINPNDGSGTSVSWAGDINGDGIDDLIIGAPKQPYGAGYSYVVFGNYKFSATFNLSSIDGTNGFTIHCISPYEYSGSPVSGAGDINADGIDDLIIGAQGVNYNAGQTYAVFGSQYRFPADFYLESLNGMNGFAINGINWSDYSGQSASGAGDVNGDGIYDIIIGASQANNRAGQTYVVFGSDNGFPAVFNLTSLNGANGFTINGIRQGDYFGNPVSEADDINADGIDDIIIGASQANNLAGQSYVIFGSGNGFPAAFNLTSMDGTDGFAINGIDPYDYTGRVSGVGDINGDGIDDVIVWNSSESYVIFGQRQLVEELQINTIIE